MNRTNDTHFFECWDLLQQIQDRLPFAKPKERSELLEMEENIFEESGFNSTYSYQEAIQAYKSR